MNIHLSVVGPPDAPSTFEHSGPVIIIGRDPECDLVLQGEAASGASRRHACIELTEVGATLTDLGSSNGTLLNGQLLDGASPLRVGDRIQMGYTGATLTVLKLDLTAAKPARVPRAVLIGAGGAGALALVVVVAVVLLHRPDSPEHARATSTEPVAVAPSDRGGPAPVGLAAPDTGRQVPSTLASEKPAEKPPADLEMKEVGAYVALDNWVSVLLRRQGEGQPWGVLRPESRVATAQTLISLPGYRSLLMLDGGMHLTLWGNLPEFAVFPPILESVVMLHAPAAGTDLDFTLDRGRVIVANRKAPSGPAHVRVRFLRETWELELPDDKTEVALELWGLPRSPGVNGGRGAPPTCLGLFTRGRVRVKTPREMLDLADHSRVSWENQEPDKSYKSLLPELPAWWTNPPDRKEPEVQKALRSLLDWSDQLGASHPKGDKRPPPPSAAAPVVTAIKTQVAEVRDPDNQDVGVFFLAALDEVEPLVDLLRDRENPNVRGATVYALQTWLSRGAEHAGELTHILERRGAARDKAELVVRLLHFYAPEALDRRETYAELIKLLDDEDLLVRDLAFWQLDQIGSGGRLPEEAKRIAYDPTADAAHRKPAVEQWKKLLADGKLPVRRR
jgi:hypothetical protein